MKRIAVFLLPILGLSATLAQEEEIGGPSQIEAIRRYTVEIVIFRYTEDFGTGTEQFYPDKIPVSDKEAQFDDGDLIGELEIDPAARDMNLLTYAFTPVSRRFELLPEDEYVLTDVLDQIERIDAYQPIMHFGWTQPTLPADQTRPIELGVFGTPPDDLQGTFSLYMGRYLHLVVNFALTAQRAGAGESAFDDPVPSFGDPVDRYIDPFAALQQPVYYRISEDRIVKDGDLRYFDHPKYGILAKITRVEDEDEQPDTEAGLLGVSVQ